MKRVIVWSIVAALTAACHREAAPATESSTVAAARTEGQPHALPSGI